MNGIRRVNFNFILKMKNDDNNISFFICNISNLYNYQSEYKFYNLLEK